MASNQPSKPPPKDTTAIYPTVLNPFDPMDNAFDLVVNHNFNIQRAMQIAQYPQASYDTLCARINWHRERSAAECATAVGEDNEDCTASRTPPKAKGSKKITNVASKVKPGATSGKKRKGKASEEVINKTVEVALNQLPGWMDRDKTEKALRRRKKITQSQKNLDNFKTKSAKEYRDARFEKVYKMATTQLMENMLGPNRGRKGYSIRSVVAKFNAEFLNCPGDRRLTIETLRQAVVSRGEVGMSPLKLGRPLKVPQEFTTALATHATMMKVAGGRGSFKQRGRRSLRTSMMATFDALTVGTKWEGKIVFDYAWRATRTRHPEIFVNDAEDRFEVGEGGAPEDVKQRMELLVQDYKDAAKALEVLGFNGNVLNIEAPEVEAPEATR